MTKKTKMCSRCGGKKPIDQFGYKKIGNKSQRTKWCDRCKKSERDRRLDIKLVKYDGRNPYNTSYVDELIEEVDSRNGVFDDE